MRRATNARRSCGCLLREALRTRKNVGHGLTNTPEYSSWKHMIRRCYGKRDEETFKNYGGRGITVCREWRHDPAAFVANVGKRPSPKHSIERVNNNRGYKPGNVRWATVPEQSRNRRSNRWITFNGERMILTDWANRLGIHSTTLYRRFQTGWSIQRALTTSKV